jgi:hypothetical protein
MCAVNLLGKLKRCAAARVALRFITLTRRIHGTGFWGEGRSGKLPLKDRTESLFLERAAECCKAGDCFLN